MPPFGSPKFESSLHERVERDFVRDPTWCLLPWRKLPRAAPRIVDELWNRSDLTKQLRARLPEFNIVNNTSRGVAPGLIDPRAGEVLGNRIDWAEGRDGKGLGKFWNARWQNPRRVQPLRQLPQEEFDYWMRE